LLLFPQQWRARFPPVFPTPSQIKIDTGWL
jgi:hypothetical protein